MNKRDCEGQIAQLSAVEESLWQIDIKVSAALGRTREVTRRFNTTEADIVLLGSSTNLYQVPEHLRTKLSLSELLHWNRDDCAFQVRGYDSLVSTRQSLTPCEGFPLPAVRPSSCTPHRTAVLVGWSACDP